MHDAVLTTTLNIRQDVSTNLVASYRPPLEKVDMTVRHALAFVSFFIAGAVVARFQWHIAFDLDRSGLIQYYFEAFLLVPVFGLLGFFLANDLKDSVLNSLIVATLLLFGLQLLWELGALPGWVLNPYARIYAVSCLVAPLVSVFIKSWRVRACIFVLLATVVIGLSATW